MGGRVTKQKVLTNKGNLAGYRELPEPYNWLSLGPIPAFSEELDCLERHQVKAIVNLTLDQVAFGCIANHQPISSKNLEWLHSDAINTDRFTWFHAPIQDGGWPEPDIERRLWTWLDQYHQDYPNNKVYVHCWGGLGRAPMIVIKYLVRSTHLTLSEAFRMVTKAAPNIELKLSNNQYNYLNDQDFSSEQVEINRPIIRTSPDHEYYQIKDRAHVFEVMVKLTTDEIQKYIIPEKDRLMDTVRSWTKERVDYLRIGDVIKVIHADACGWTVDLVLIYTGNGAYQKIAGKGSDYLIPSNLNHPIEYWSELGDNIKITQK